MRARDLRRSLIGAGALGALLVTASTQAASHDEAVRWLREKCAGAHCAYVVSRDGDTYDSWQADAKQRCELEITERSKSVGPCTYEELVVCTVPMKKVRLADVRAVSAQNEERTRTGFRVSPKEAADLTWENSAEFSCLLTSSSTCIDRPGPSTIQRRRARIGFDSEDLARRAANAVKDIARECGAKEEKEPY